MGNADSKTGYGCEMVAMVKLWRQAWSKEPGTTDPLAPFGIVSLASGGSEGGTDIAGMRSSQTGNYGSLPSIDMPNTFLAHAFDIGDPWQGYSELVSRSFCFCLLSSTLVMIAYARAGFWRRNLREVRLLSGDRRVQCDTLCGRSMDRQGWKIAFAWRPSCVQGSRMLNVRGVSE